MERSEKNGNVFTGIAYIGERVSTNASVSLGTGNIIHSPPFSRMDRERERSSVESCFKFVFMINAAGGFCTSHEDKSLLK